MKTFKDQIDKEHLIDLLNLTNNLLSYVDTNYIYRAVNDAYKRKYKKPANQIIGRYIWDVFGQDTFENIVKPHLDKAFLGSKVEYQSWFEFPNLPRMYLIVTYKPSFTDDLHVEGVVVSAIDYTKVKELEEEKKEQELILQEISKMAQLGEMISFIAHQWRQPLNTLATNLLKLRQLTSKNKHTEQTIERCEAILEELSSHVESINTSNPENFNKNADSIKNIFDSIFILIQERIYIFGITIKLNCQEIVQISSQRDVLFHVILAILENAIDALAMSITIDKKIDISVYTENQNVLIDIQDNGDGISYEHSKHIFEPGFSTKKATGRGYGLYFAQKLLFQKLRGYIELKSSSDQGAWFRVILPLEKQL